MEQAVVCRRLRTLRRASALEHGSTQRARRRSRPPCLRGLPDGQTAMHEYLSCAISRLPSYEAATILRVPERLPGLHPILLYRFGTRIALRAAVPKIAESASPGDRCFDRRLS